jgi:chromosomal replication initiation ATPase DnaA
MGADRRHPAARLETRIAILKKKSERETIALPDDLFYFLAEQVHDAEHETQNKTKAPGAVIIKA